MNEEARRYDESHSALSAVHEKVAMQERRLSEQAATIEQLQRQLEAVGATAGGGGDVSVRGTIDRGLSVDTSARVRELEEQAALRASEAATIGEKLRESETARAQLESQLRSNISGQAVAAAELTKERRAVEELQRQLGARAHEAAEATAKCSELSEQLSHRDEVVASLRAASNTRDRSLLETMEAERRALQDQVAKHAADVKLLSEQLAAERDRAARVSVSPDKQPALIDVVADLEDELSQCRSKEGEIKKRMNEEARRYDESHSALSAVHEKVAMQERRLSEQAATIEQLQRQLEAVGATAGGGGDVSVRGTSDRGLSVDTSARVRELEEQAALRASEAATIGEKLRESETARAQLESQLRSNIAGLSVAVSELTKERRAVEELQRQLDARAQEAAEATAKCSELSEQLSHRDEVVASLRAASDTRDRSLLETMEAERRALQDQVAKHAADVKLLSEQLAAERDVSAAKERQLEAVGATSGDGGDVSVRGTSDRGLSVDAGARVRELEEQAALRASEAATVGEKLRESETARAQLESQLRSNISGQAVAAAELTKERRAVEELQRQLDARAHEAAEATAKCTELSEQLSHHNEVVASLRAASNTRDRSLLETMEAERRALQDQVAKHAADVKLLSEQLAAERDVSAAKERQLEAVGATAGGGGDVSVRGTSDRGLSVDTAARVRELEERELFVRFSVVDEETSSLLLSLRCTLLRLERRCCPLQSCASTNTPVLLCTCACVGSPPLHCSDAAVWCCLPYREVVSRVPPGSISAAAVPAVSDVNLDSHDVEKSSAPLTLSQSGAAATSSKTFVSPLRRAAAAVSPVVSTSMRTPPPRCDVTPPEPPRRAGSPFVERNVSPRPSCIAELLQQMKRERESHSSAMPSVALPTRAPQPKRSSTPVAQSPPPTAYTPNHVSVSRHR